MQMTNLKNPTRRAFLKTTTGMLGGLALPRIAELQAANGAGPSQISATEIMRRQGEPIELAGKRLIFTHYHYIRPAGFGWYDEKGNNVTVAGTAGLWDAHLRVTDAPVGIRIVAQPAERSLAPFPGIEPVKPWEDGRISLGHTLYDEEDGYFKTWTTCSTGRCFLRSKDFENWERPELGLLEFKGSRNNNLVEADDLGWVFKDPSSHAERWKWIGERNITRQAYETFQKMRPRDWDSKSDRVDVPQETHVGPGNLILAVKGGVSRDGFRWQTIAEPLVVQHADTINTAYYDTQLKKYVAYLRHWIMPVRSARAPTDDRGLSWMAGRRSIGRSETDDFRRFPVSECILTPGPDIVGPSDSLYTNGHSFVPFAPDQHLFFPTIWHQINDSTSVAVASSLDGKLLHWLPGNPVLTTAPFEQWDGGCLFAKGNLIELPDGRWILPYSASNVPHKYPRKGAIKGGVGFATWKKGRLVAVEAVERGQFTTFALMPPGRRLHLNALTVRGGSILVEVTDAARKTVPGHSFEDCKPVIGDQYRTRVTWKGGDDLGIPEGVPVCLRFKLDQAKLFFLDFD
jgi:hypothetical protein